MKDKNKDKLNVLNLAFKKYKVNPTKLRTTIMLLILQIVLTLVLVGVENWLAILPQMLELITILEKIDEVEKLNQ